MEYCGVVCGGFCWDVAGWVGLDGVDSYSGRSWIGPDRMLRLPGVRWGGTGHEDNGAAVGHEVGLGGTGRDGLRCGRVKWDGVWYGGER